MKEGFAAIGRTDKFISPKTIKAVHGQNVELWEPGEYAVVKDGKLEIRRAENEDKSYSDCGKKL